MKSYKHKTGVTLVEILVVVAVIALLVSMVIGIAARLDSQGKERLTENTFAILDAALSQFQNYGYEYKLVPNLDPNSAEAKFYRSLDFPIDCNGLPYDPQLRTEWGRALGFNRTIAIEITGGTHDKSYSGSEVLYFFLSRVPESRETLDKIDRKLITNLGINGQPMDVIIGLGTDVKKKYPLLRVIDPWGTTLRYDYYNDTGTFAEKMESKKTFPVITSAGPDKIFGTSDDIKSRD
jgi:prepilin-type N-terminal cleavage/methylation domain-containing protein